MKKLCCWLLTFLLLVGVAPGAWAAKTPAFTVGQTEYPFSADASDSGWNYDAQTQTLTLSGLRYPDDDVENYLDFSEAEGEFHLILADGSENAVGMMSANDQTVISGTGSLSVNTIYGSLTVKSGTLSGGCIYGGCLTVDGGQVILERTKALSEVTVKSGSLTVGGLDTYSLVQEGGTLRASLLSNCNGTAVSNMKYCLTGGSLILENTDPNNPWGVFNCVSYDTSPRLLEQALGGMGGSLTGADGQPLMLRYTGYPFDGEPMEGLTGEEEQYYAYISANLYNSDGTAANYAEFRPTAVCTHSGDKRYCSGEELHWQACISCGADLPDTRETHHYLAFGADKLCICGARVEGDGTVEAQAAELSLYLWATGTPMPYAVHKALDKVADGTVTLAEVAHLQFAAEGKDIPARFLAVSMAYEADGRAKTVLSQPGDLGGAWQTAKLYVLAGATCAPLVQPVSVSCR